MTNSRMTKAELISYVNQLEQETIEAKLRTVATELRLLGNDLLKVVGIVYNAGYRTGSYFYRTLPAIRDRIIHH